MIVTNEHGETIYADHDYCQQSAHQIGYNLKRIQKAVSLPRELLNQYASAYYALVEGTLEKLNVLILPALSDGISYSKENKAHVEKAFEKWRAESSLMETLGACRQAIYQGDSSEVIRFLRYLRDRSISIALQIGNGVIDEEIDQWWSEFLRSGFTEEGF